MGEYGKGAGGQPYMIGEVGCVNSGKKSDEGTPMMTYPNQY